MRGDAPTSLITSATTKREVRERPLLNSWPALHFLHPQLDFISFQSILFSTILHIRTCVRVLVQSQLQYLAVKFIRCYWSLKPGFTSDKFQVWYILVFLKPWAPHLFYSELQQEIISGDSWGDRLIVSTTKGTYLVEGTLEFPSIFVCIRSHRAFSKDLF